MKNIDPDYAITETTFFNISCEGCGISTAPHTDEDDAIEDAKRLGFVERYDSEAGTLNFCAQCNAEDEEIQLSCEQMARDILTQAVKDKLVRFDPNDWHPDTSGPQELLSGDVVGVANLISEMLRDHKIRIIKQLEKEGALSRNSETVEEENDENA